MRKAASTSKSASSGAPLSVRPLQPFERETLEAASRSHDTLVLRRSKILLARAGGEHVYKIAHTLGCSKSTVKDTIRAFNSAGLGGLGLEQLAHRDTAAFVATDDVAP